MSRNDTMSNLEKFDKLEAYARQQYQNAESQYDKTFYNGYLTALTDVREAGLIGD